MANETDKNNIVKRGYDRLLQLFNIQRTSQPDEVDISRPDNSITFRKHSKYELSKLGTHENSVKNTTDPSSYLKEVMDMAEEVIEDIRALYAMNPEIPLAKSILVSSIISPNDFQTDSILVTCQIDGLSSEIQQDLNEYLAKLFNDELKFASRLEKWLGNALFDYGASPVLVIPRVNTKLLAARDNYVKYKVTGDKKYIEDIDISAEGFIGIAEVVDTTLSMESELIVCSDDAIDMVITDNEIHAAIEAAVPKVKDRSNPKNKNVVQTAASKVKSEVNKKLKEVSSNIIISTDVSCVNDNSELKNKLGKIEEQVGAQFKNLSGQGDMMLLSDEGIEDDYCAILETPPSATIPITVPGAPSRHIGYFLVTDYHGRPMNIKNKLARDGSTDNIIGEMTDTMFGGNYLGSLIKSISEKDKHNMMSNIFGIAISNMMKRTFSKITDLDEGVEEISIDDHEAITNCLLYTMMSNQKIKLVFVPASLMTYYAFEYKDNGMGKSLIEDLSYLLSLRTSLIISKTLATMREAEDNKTVEVEIQDTDTNIEETLATVKELFIRKRYPKFSNNPHIATRELIGHAVSVVPSSIPGISDKLGVQVNDNAPSSASPDSEILDYLDEMISVGFGVPPSAINKMKEEEYAVSVATNNLFFSNNIRRKQSVVVECNNKLAANYIRYNSDVKDKILEILKDSVLNKDAQDRDVSNMQLVLSNLNLGLASPKMSATKAQMEELDSFMDLVDKVVERVYNDDMYGIDDRDAAESIKSIRTLIKSDSVREFIHSSGLANMFNIPDTEDLPSHKIRDFMRYVKHLNDGMVKFKEALDKGKEGDDSSSGGSSW